MNSTRSGVVTKNFHVSLWKERSIKSLYICLKLSSTITLFSLLLLHHRQYHHSFWTNKSDSFLFHFALYSTILSQKWNGRRSIHHRHPPTPLQHEDCWAGAFRNISKTTISWHAVGVYRKHQDAVPETVWRWLSSATGQQVNASNEELYSRKPSFIVGTGTTHSTTLRGSHTTNGNVWHALQTRAAQPDWESKRRIVSKQPHQGNVCVMLWWFKYQVCITCGTIPDLPFTFPPNVCDICQRASMCLSFKHIQLNIPETGCNNSKPSACPFCGRLPLPHRAPSSCKLLWLEQ